MISSQLAILDQAISYLESMTAEEYTKINRPLFISSAGGHMRHIIDHYQAMMEGLKSQLIDYDKRSRGGDMETSPQAALQEIENIRAFLLSLSTEQLNKEMHLSTEISVTNRQVAKVKTTLGRELIFAGSHAIHHFAMIAQISKAQHKNIPENFGIAPATATFLRGEKCAH